jgi:hypothetical protein
MSRNVVMPPTTVYRQTLAWFRRPVFGVVQLIALLTSMIPPGPVSFGYDAATTPLTLTAPKDSLHHLESMTLTANLSDTSSGVTVPISGAIVIFQ